MDVLNSGINFQSLLVIVIIYIIVLWLMFCVWVFLDARKRYQNTIVALIFFILVLILNFPILVFYLIIRPEKQDDNVFYIHDPEGHSEGGVNIPLVNFMGNEGLDLTLQIKVNRNINEGNKDMKINVDWVSKNEKLHVQEKVEKPVKEEVSQTKKSDNNKKTEDKKSETEDHTKLQTFGKNFSKKSRKALSKIKTMGSEFLTNVKSFKGISQ